MQLIKHQYEGRSARHYINGKRVTKEYYEHAVGRLQRIGASLNSFKTEVVKEGHVKQYACI